MSVTVLKAVPAVAFAGAVTLKWSAPAAPTLIVAVPVADVWTVSFTVTVGVPAVLSVTPFVNVCEPLSPATKV